jgi:hypothetical protein
MLRENYGVGGRDSFVAIVKEVFLVNVVSKS